MYERSRRYQQAAGMRDGALTERCVHMRDWGAKEKGSLAISGQRIGAPVGVLKRTTEFSGY